MWRPDGPTLGELGRAGVARITFGSGLHMRVMRQVREMASQLAADAVL
jgi:hypothetical protein